jgi:hypothetical protein
MADTHNPLQKDGQLFLSRPGIGKPARGKVIGGFGGGFTKKFRSETAPKRGKFHNESNRLSGIQTRGTAASLAVQLWQPALFT